MTQPRVLRREDESSIIEFEKSRLAQTVPDEAERELQSWHASWRKESLEHYLPLGWSFGIWDEKTGQLMGYYIAQPQLFLCGMTQTLWVERLVATTPELTADLIELSYRICREKHFQKVLFCIHADSDLANSVFQLNRISDNLMELKTAKF